MNGTREAMYAALFAKLSGLTFTLPDGKTTFLTTARKYIPWSDLSSDQQPALLMVQKKETAVRNGRGIPIKWILNVDVVVYVNTTGDTNNTIPVQYLNAIMDAIEAAFPMEGIAQVETLGGKVDRVEISGTVEHDEGVLGSQGWMVVPIQIHSPA